MNKKSKNTRPVKDFFKQGRQDFAEAQVFAMTASLLQGMKDGVLLFDKKGRVVLANPSFLKMEGSEEKAPSLAMAAKCFNKSGVDLKKLVNKALSQEKTISLDELCLRERVYQAVIAPVWGLKKKVLGGALILHDITHITEIDKMKTEFVSVVSHQLRTPLTAIRLFNEMLMSEEVGELTEKQKDYLENIQNSTERMIKLVNDLLNVSRLETGRLAILPKKMQLEGFIRSLIKELTPLAKSYNCSIFFKKPQKPLLKMMVDPTLLRQVFHNLLTNAIKYTKLAKKSRIYVKIARSQTGKEVLVSVKDEGIGIDKKAQPVIFEKFFRADVARRLSPEGSGLGLYVSKMIIEASGGRIWFESAGYGRGAVFFIALPQQGMKAKKGVKGLVV